MSPECLYASLAFDPDTSMNYTFSVNKKPFSQLHYHDFYEITIVTSGQVCHYVNGFEQLLSCDTMIFLRPHDVHCFSSVGLNDFEYINFAFSEENLSELLNYLDVGFDREAFNHSVMPPMTQLSSAETFDIRNRLDRLTLFDSENKDKKKTYFRLLVADLFFKYFHNASETIKLHPLWFDELIRQMNEPDNFRCGISQFEVLSGKSLAYISRVFKDQLHTTPTDYLNNLRINYCASRLLHSDTPIIDIALDAGYNNLSHFYHLFKEKYSISPKQYRKERLKIF